jgi:hypothetical protein
MEHDSERDATNEEYIEAMENLNALANWATNFFPIMIRCASHLHKEVFNRAMDKSTYAVSDMDLRDENARRVRIWRHYLNTLHPIEYILFPFRLTLSHVPIMVENLDLSVARDHIKSQESDLYVLLNGMHTVHKDKYKYILPFLGVQNRYASDKKLFNFDKICFAGPHPQEYHGICDGLWSSDRNEIAMKMAESLRKLPVSMKKQADMLSLLNAEKTGRIWILVLRSTEMKSYIKILSEHTSKLAVTFNDEKHFPKYWRFTMASLYNTANAVAQSFVKYSVKEVTSYHAVHKDCFSVGGIPGVEWHNGNYDGSDDDGESVQSNSSVFTGDCRGTFVKSDFHINTHAQAVKMEYFTEDELDDDTKEPDHGGEKARNYTQGYVPVVFRGGIEITNKQELYEILKGATDERYGIIGQDLSNSVSRKELASDVVIENRYKYRNDEEVEYVVHIYGNKDTLTRIKKKNATRDHIENHNDRLSMNEAQHKQKYYGIIRNKKRRKKVEYASGQFLVCPEGENCLEQYKIHQSNHSEYNGRPFEKLMPDDYDASTFRKINRNTTGDGERYVIDLDECVKPNKIQVQASRQWKTFQVHINRCIGNPDKRPKSFMGVSTNEVVERGHCGCKSCKGNHELGIILPEYTVKRHVAFTYRDEEDQQCGYPDLRDNKKKTPSDRVACINSGNSL